MLFFNIYIFVIVMLANVLKKKKNTHVVPGLAESLVGGLCL